MDDGVDYAGNGPQPADCDGYGPQPADEDVAEGYGPQPADCDGYGPQPAEPAEKDAERDEADIGASWRSGCGAYGPGGHLEATAAVFKSR